MKWIKSPDNTVMDMQNLVLICLLPEKPDEFRDKIIEVAPEMFDAVFSFVKGIEDNSFKAKSIYNELKAILDRFPKHLIDEYESMQV